MVPSTFLGAHAAVSESTREEVDVELYTGTYFDPGYGAITLCSAQSTSSHCLEILDDFAPCEPPSDDLPNPNRLYARVDRFYFSHIRLTHQSDHKFEANAISLFPYGYGMNRTAFEDYRSAGVRVEFVVQDIGNGTKRVEAFGIVTDEDAAKMRERVTGSAAIRDVAEAWFIKV